MSPSTHQESDESSPNARAPAEFDLARSHIRGLWGAVLSRAERDFHKGPGGAFLTTSSRSCDVRSCVKSDSPFTLSCLFLSSLVHTTVCVTSVTITSPSFLRKNIILESEKKVKKNNHKGENDKYTGKNNGANGDFDSAACTVAASLRFHS